MKLLVTDYDNTFIGTFDGNNHTIKNYKMDERTYNGLFGYWNNC